MMKGKTVSNDGSTATPSSVKSSGKRAPVFAGKKWTTTSYLLALLGASIALSAVFNYYHSFSSHTNSSNNSHGLSSNTDHRKHPKSASQQLVLHKKDFLKHAKAFSQERRKKQVNNNALQSSSSSSASSLTQSHMELNCKAHGGPMDRDAAQEMVYWQDIPSDTQYQSPFHQINQREQQNGGRTKYMTFEPDGGGWNNIRMAMETILGLAVATGRVLVLPPEQSMYLLKKDASKQKINFSFQDFFPMHELAAEQKGLHIITTKEFLEREALTGHLRNKYTGEVEFPPFNNRTEWNGEDIKPLKEWLRNVTLTPLWQPSSCMAAFPASADPKDGQKLVELLETMHEKGDFETRTYVKDPVPVNASTYDRLKDNINRRAKLCLYDKEMQEAPVLHFMCYHKMRVRFLTHFYSFLFLEDWREDLWMKRFMRDHVRYIDEIQCAAGRVVQALRQLSYNLTQKSHEFDTFHIRRGDFQFKQTRLEANEIYDNVKEVLAGVDEPPQGNQKAVQAGVVFIATDERNKDFFAPLRKHYPHLYFLDDFKHLLTNVNTNYYGMIDQLVASRGRLFFGCWHSTFTGFINRMRGYHSQKERLAGYETGALKNTFYYVPREHLRAMHKYAPLLGASFNRENPTAWRNLDHGVAAIDDYMQHYTLSDSASPQ